MFVWHLENALRSMKRNPALTTLVGSAIAVGIGVSITMLTLFYLMSSNPIPQKSDQLHRVLVDSWGPLRPFDEDHPERAPFQMTWRDANALLEAGRGYRQVAMFESVLIIQPSAEGALPFQARTRVTSSDFFSMFDVPFLYGGGWSRQSDVNREPVMVLSRKTNNRLFGGEDSTGKKVLANDRFFTVVGVMDTWEPIPRFYDVINGPYQLVNEVFIPLSLTPGMKLSSAGSDWGWKPEPINNFDDWLNSESAWLQYWTELRSPSAKEAYLAHLDNYALEQKKLGRFERPLNNHVYNVMEWMDYNEVVVTEVRVLVGLGFLFLVVCLLSSISLLLTKFNAKTGEISIRRALGASRANIIYQNLVEVGLIGAAGGLAGIGLTWLSLRGLRASVTQAPPPLFEMDWVMVGAALVIAVGTALLAGIYPAWKACLIPLAQELKTQ